jgi:hypothetical protein
VRPTLDARALAEIDDAAALAIARSRLAWLRSSTNPFIVDYVEHVCHQDRLCEAGRWLDAADKHGYLAALLANLDHVANAPVDEKNDHQSLFFAFQSWMAEGQAAYFFLRTGWTFRSWNPPAFKALTPPRDIDFVLGAPDGSDLFVQVKAPDASATFDGDDRRVWLAIEKAAKKSLPQPAPGPTAIVVCANRMSSLAYRPHPVDRLLLGTTVQSGSASSIPSVYRGAFFDAAFRHVGAVVLLDAIRGEDELLYACTVYLNPCAEPAARCRAEWFSGARVCQVIDDVVLWSPEPPASGVPPETRLEAAAAAGEPGDLEIPNGTLIERDASEAVYRPMSTDLLDDAIVGPALRTLRANSPAVIQMVAEVDRSLIWTSLAQSPAERLRRSTEMATMLEEARRASR